jgi:hypothetical protein
MHVSGRVQKGICCIKHLQLSIFPAHIHITVSTHNYPYPCLHVTGGEPCADKHV